MIQRLLSILLVVAPVCVKAQIAVDDWQIHKPYSSIQLYNNDVWSEPYVGNRFVDTPDKLYYVSSGALYSFDKDTEETYSYSSRNKLSDNYVEGIWYNPAGKYLFISYDGGNIDILYDNGKVNNIADIRDAMINYDKMIYDVAFDGDRAYVGTSFGVVALNVPQRKVIESGIYGKKITGLAVLDGKLVVNVGYGPYELRYIDPKAKRLNSWDNYTLLSQSIYGNTLRSLGTNTLLTRMVSSGDYVPGIYTIDFANNRMTKAVVVQDAVDYFMPTKSGKWAVQSSDGSRVYLISPDGSYTTVNIPDKLSGVASMWDSPKNVWIGADKVAEYDLSSATPVALHQPFSPITTSVSRAYILSTTPSDKIVLGNMGVSTAFCSSSYGLTRKERGRINVWTDGEFVDITPQLSYSYPAINWNNRYSDYYDILGIAEDPQEADTYYVTNFWSGLDKIQRSADGTWHDVWHVDESNSPLELQLENVIIDNVATQQPFGVRAGTIAFDRNNNLWMIRANSESDKSGDAAPIIMMLPAEARKKSKIQKSDWKTIKVNPFKTSFDTQILVCQHSNMIFFNDGSWPANILAYDTKGTANINDDEYLVLNKFVDQDGKSFSQQRIFSMCEDKEGRVWLGTHSGILEITNPSQATNPNMTINRLKVPRNDGSGFADYLLDAQQVNTITTDGANNKWVGTQGSGLYYVAGSGDKVLNHYTTDNSYLVDNLVYRVACDPNSTSVLISNPYAIVEYGSQVSPTAESFSDVYAYPNPVRPGYSGWITVKGLVDGSRVKIADAAGNVFLDKLAEGGSVSWDGNNRDGSRVKSGVYFVFVSKTGEGISSSGAVTKIVVIN